MQIKSITNIQETLKQSLQQQNFNPLMSQPLNRQRKRKQQEAYFLEGRNKHMAAGTETMTHKLNTAIQTY